MTWQHITYFISIIITTAIMGFIAWYSRRKKETTAGAGIYMWIAILVSLVAIFQGISMVGPTEEWALFWLNVRIACFAAIPVLWLAFVFHFIGKPGLLSKTRIGLLFVVPVITQIMLWTNDLHGLWVARDVAFNRAGPFFMPLTSARVMGPWYVVHILYTNVLMLAGIIILFVMSIRMRHQDRNQALILGTGTLIMVLGALMPSLNILPGMMLNLIPQSLALGSLIIAWGLYRHRFLGETPQYDEEKRIPRKLVFLFVLLAGGILMTGFAYYRLYEKHHRDEIENQLSAIADLKVGEIVQWRKERMGDANIFHQNAAFAAMVRRYYANPTDANARWQIQRWMSKYLVYRDYLRVYLTDVRGVIMMSAPEGSPALVIPHLARDAAAVLSSGQIDFQDLHRDSPGGPVHMAVMVPVIDEQDGRLPLGLIVFRIDPAAYLYPMLNRWPTPSKTAETLLVRRDGDNVLFLNELKYKKDTALNLRFPLSMKRLPAAMAVLGQEGVVDGIDYRGIPVVAALRAVPDSPWFMVARMDSAEVYAPVRERFWVMVVVVLLLVAGAGTGIGLLWRRQSDRFYRDRYESAEALRQSEEKFSLAFKSSSYAITITRPEDGRFVDVNEAFTAITGYTRDEALTGSSIWLDLWADAGDREDVLKELTAGRSVAGREYRFRNKDGGTIVGLFSAGMLHLENEQVVLSSINDITDRKRAEDALRIKNLVFDASLAACSIADLNGVITQANDAFLKVWGYADREDVIGKPISWFIRDESESSAIVEALNETGAWEGNFTAKRKDGSTFIAQSQATMLRDETGALIGYQSAVLDITDRKRAEAELRAVLNHQDTLLTAIPDIIMEVDVNKVYTWSNRPGLEFFGDDVIGREAADYFEGEQDTYQSVQSLFNGYEDVIYLESWQRRKDGEKRLLAWWCTVLKDRSGTVIGALSSARDITEHKLAEEELKRFANELKRSNMDLQQFAYVASHDLQEPLRMISSYLQLIERRYGDRLDSDGIEFINFAVGGATRLQALINGLLEFSRVQTHGKPFVSVDMTQIIDAVRQDLGKLIEDTDATIKYGDLPAVKADEHQVGRLLQNLVQNALKFSRSGAPPVITISAVPGSHEHLFCVRDNGIGIDEQYFKRIFNIFQRLHSREEYPGTGIGLSICKRIVERHGGRIWVESKPGEGSAFYFTLPASVVEKKK